MRTILIAMAGFAVVAGIGVATFVVLPTADGGPLHPIEVTSPDRVEPIAPQQVTPPRLTPSTTVAPPPAPTEDADVPEPPPALWRTDAPAADREADDDGDDDDDDGDDGDDD